MATYFVHHGGNGTGGTTDPTTGGDWSAAYASVQAVNAAVTLGTGDIIKCSDQHVSTNATTTIIDAQILIISVDHDDTSLYSAGAFEKVLTNGEFDFAQVYSVGVDYICYGDFRLGDSNSNERTTVLIDCTLQIDSNDNQYCVLNNGTIWYNVTLQKNHCNTNDTFFDFANTGRLEMWGGAIINGDTVTNSYLIDYDSNGAPTMEFYGVDLSQIDCTYLCNDMADAKQALFQRCKMPSTYTLYNGTMDGSCNIVILGSGTGDDYYSFETESPAGTTELETTIYRSATYDGTTNYCHKVVTTAACSEPRPVRRLVFRKWIDTGDFTTTVTATMRAIRVDSTTLLTESELWFEAQFPDGADNALAANKVSKSSNYGSTTNVTDDDGGTAWTGRGATYKQMSDTIAMTIGASAGNIATGWLEIYACVGKASQTVYIDADVGLA